MTSIARLSRWVRNLHRPLCAPEGNGHAERFIRILKENLLWVRAFDTIEELQAILQKFKDDYNEQWLILRHGHSLPNQFRRDAMDKIPAAA